MFSRLGIGARLFIAFLGIAALSLSSGVAGWWILRGVSEAQSRMTAEALPAVAAAQKTGDATRRILAAGQNLAAATDEATRSRFAGEIAALSGDIRQALADAALSQLDYASLSQMSGNAESLFANLDDQNRLVREKLRLLKSFEARADRTLVAASVLVDLSETLVSNASAGASAVVAGLYGLIEGGTPAQAYDALDRLIEQDIYLLDRMWELRLRSSQLVLLTNRLSRAITREEVEGLAQEFSAHLRIVKRRVASIDDPIRQAQAQEQLPALRSAAGEMRVNSSLFEDRLRLIGIGEELDSVAERNRALSAQLNSVAQNVMENAQRFALATSAQADSAVAAGLWVLLASSCIAIILSGLIVWFYVERGVVRRLRELAAAMHRLTVGDLNVEVAQGGTHELKDLSEAVAVFRDESRQRRALEAERERTNEELRRHREELQELVNERTEQLSREVESHAAARETAERASRAKSDFLATVSHEIRTPMSGMLGMLRLLKDTAQNREQQRRIATASNAGEALLGILNSILDYSKIESGKITLDSEVFRLDELLKGIVDLMKPSAEEKSLCLTLVLADRIAPCLEGDAGKLRQIVFNLVGNAIKFTAEGSITVTARAADQGAGQQRIEIAVKDTGIGIPPAAQQKIFESFTQTDGSITRRYGGTGLGLAISRGLAEAMRGQLGVISAPGEGSTFTLTLDFKVADAETRDASVDQLSQTVPSGLSVLVVEDDEATREVALHFLAALGHRCRVAKDGYEALALVTVSAPQLVLMDISLPGIDGLGTARLLRQAAHPASLRFVAMSAHAAEEEAQRYLASGMDAYIAKPLTPEALSRAILDALRDEVSLPLVDGAAWRTDIATLGSKQMRRVLDIAARTLPERIASLRHALSLNDMPELATSAHAACSTASAAGFPRLLRIFRDIEEAARRAEAHHCTALLEEAERVWPAAVEDARALLAVVQETVTPGRAGQRKDNLHRVT